MKPVFFCYGSDFLSNFHMKDYVYNDIKFCCVEQGYQYEKAKLSGDLDVCQLILKASNPYDHKRYCRQVQLTTEWELLRVKAMYNHCNAKFQNKELSALLLSTGNRLLIERSKTDTFWGCTVSGDQYSGRNMLGRILMKIRRQISDNNFNKLTF